MELLLRCILSHFLILVKHIAHDLKIDIRRRIIRLKEYKSSIRNYLHSTLTYQLPSKYFTRINRSGKYMSKMSNKYLSITRLTFEIYNNCQNSYIISHLYMWFIRVNLYWWYMINMWIWVYINS